MKASEVRIKLIAGPTITQPCQDVVVFVPREETGPLQLRQLIQHLGGILPDEDQVVFRHYHTGSLIRTSIMDVLYDSTDSQNFKVDPSLTECILIITYDLLQTGKPHKVASLIEPDWIRSVDTDGEQVLTGSYDRVVRYYQKSQLRGQWTGVHRDTITVLRWLDTDRFISGSANGELFVWSVKHEGGPLKGLETGRKGAIHDIVVVNDELMAIDSEGFWSIFSISNPSSQPHSAKGTKKSRKEPVERPLRDERITTSPTAAIIKISEGEWMIGTWSGQLISLPNPKKMTFHTKHIIANTRPISAMCTVGRILLITGHANGMISLWKIIKSGDEDELHSIELVSTIMGHQGWIAGLASSTDGTTFVSAGYDGRLLWWDIEGNNLSEPRQTLLDTGGKKILSISWKDDLLVVGGESKQLDLVSFSSSR